MASRATAKERHTLLQLLAVFDERLQDALADLPLLAVWIRGIVNKQQRVSWVGSTRAHTYTASCNLHKVCGVLLHLGELVDRARDLLKPDVQLVLLCLFRDQQSLQSHNVTTGLVTKGGTPRRDWLTHLLVILAVIQLIGLLQVLHQGR